VGLVIAPILGGGHGEGHADTVNQDRTEVVAQATETLSE